MKLTELESNLATRIEKGALLTATDKNGRVNTMTVSWGGTGILWGKNVCFVFVRPERYTYEFSESGDTMTLSFLGDGERGTLSLCGTKSGRDVDKFEACDLKYTMQNGACILEKAELTLVLKKLYADDLKDECFVNDTPKSFYKNGGYHKMYVCEVVDILEGKDL